VCADAQVLVQPLKSLGGTRRVWRKILISWLLALIFAVPQLLIFVQTQERRSSLSRSQDVIVYGCKSSGYTAEWQRKVYFTFMTSYILIIPTCIMTFCYVRITCVVWLRADTSCSTPPDIDMPRIHFVTSRRSPAESAGHSGRSHGHRQTQDLPRCRAYQRPPTSVVVPGVPTKLAVTSKRNVVKMTMSVIVGFVVCWTPYFIVSLVRIYSDYRYTLTTALSVSELMALGHSAINPFLYILFSTRAVRAAFSQLRQRVLPRCCLRRRRRRGQGRAPAVSHRPWVVPGAVDGVRRRRRADDVRLSLSTAEGEWVEVR